MSKRSREDTPVRRRLRFGYVTPLTADYHDEKGNLIQPGFNQSPTLTFYEEELLWFFNLDPFTLLADVDVDMDVEHEIIAYGHGLTSYRTSQYRVMRIRTLQQYFEEVSVFTLHDMARFEGVFPGFFVHYVPLSRSDFWRWYVRRCPEVLKFMERQPEDLVELAVLANPAAILASNPNTQTEQLWLMAVQQDPMLLGHVPSRIKASASFKTRVVNLAATWCDAFSLIQALAQPPSE